MRLSDAQAQLMLQILMDSLKLSDGQGLIFSYSHPVRAQLYDEIIAQQNREPKDLSEYLSIDAINERLERIEKALSDALG